MLPEIFAYTQQNLQDFVDCPRRFYLRHVLKLEWPAIESEPVREQEARMLLGTRFHLLCQQYFSGVPAERLTGLIDDPDLSLWWQNFLKLGLNPAPGSFAVEKLISVPFSGARLTAKFDLLAGSKEKGFTLFDWKTSLHQPKRQTVLERMQSKVYPLVTALSGIAPDSIEMIYWYPAFPESPIRFSYSSAQMEDDQARIESLILEIGAKLKEEEFIRAENPKVCIFCRYRSLCDRGVSAGSGDPDLDPEDFEKAFEIDFDAV